MSTLEIDLTPEQEAQIRMEAHKRRQPIPEYARTVLLQSQESAESHKHSILELEGLGAEIWKDEQGKLIDAQAYVNALRREWDHRP